MADSLTEAQKIWDRRKKEEEEWDRDYERRADERSRNRTPEESRQIFYEIGILDENGQVAEGQEALHLYLLEQAKKMKE